jgi:anti-sigma regulatory factor (Ser/Thr protein kinase)
MTEIDASIRNRREELARVRDAVDRLGAECRLASGIVEDMQVALDEVLTNILNYAYTDQGEHEIRVRLRIVDGALEAMVEDDGKPFNPLQMAPPDTRAPLRERRIGGVGLHFVRNLMTDVRYDRVGDRNRLVLTKQLTA